MARHHGTIAPTSRHSSADLLTRRRRSAGRPADGPVPGQIINTVIDLLLTSSSPRLRDITEEAVSAVLTDNPTRSARRLGLSMEFSNALCCASGKARWPE